MARSGWGRKVAPVCPPVARDVLTAVVVSVAGTVPGMALAALREGERALLTGASLGAAGGLALGMAVNLLAARRGRRLVAVACALGAAALAADAGLRAPAHAGPAGLLACGAAHGAWTALALTFPRAYRWLWGMPARNGFLRRRWDPVDPLGA